MILCVKSVIFEQIKTYLMAISKYAAKEIYTNPRDMEISIKEDGVDKLYFEITHGPMRGRKSIIKSMPLLCDTESLIDLIEAQLHSIYLYGLNNLNHAETKWRKLLTEEIIQCIMYELRENKIVKVYQLKL